MRYIIYITLFVLIGSTTAFGAESIPEARADIFDSGGKNIGMAIFKQTPDGVRITLEVHDLAPGLHGMHIHAAGECKTPHFKSAEGHFNPYGKQHGLKNPRGPHAGDLPNLLVQPDGTAKVTIMAPLVTLSPGKASLLSGKGTALVIHAKPDDEMTDPAGNSGERIACGVITK
jgi:Cu-Zn family superoxide dismutase